MSLAPVPVVSKPSPSKVDFPSSDPSAQLVQYARPPHLPFRRISVPTAPTLQNRQSVASITSYDSFPEERSRSGTSVYTVPPVIKTVSRKSKAQSSPLEGGKKKSRSNQLFPVDEAREAKRSKIIHEFYDTEKSYVDGLELIYSHFLMPIIASLDTPHPLLNRTELTSVFSNFIDIWNFHGSFFSSLSNYLYPAESSSPQNPPPLSPILLSHFPYLSLYTPFVASFSTAMASLTVLLRSNASFAVFISEQEQDPRCGKLKLRDWLLTIVQRCPRYLLLLKDLTECTESADQEHAQLTAVHTLVSRITMSLNTSLQTHAQTLSLLALQRSTPNLPFQLISPGRTFLKRGALLQLERSTSPREREFLLFSDCLIWLASADRADSDLAEKWNWGPGSSVGSNLPAGPGLVRSRSKSEAELPTLKTRMTSLDGIRQSAHFQAKKKARHASSGQEDRWIYKGRIELVDLEVIVPPSRERADEKRLDILSPETSFSVYAETEIQRDDWCTAVRTAKASQLVSLTAMNPNSTLTSSSASTHLRRSLQALPHLPEEETRNPRRGRVEHFLPAIWIPDSKTETCMRCGRTFGWRRRRHHCRLCGRCICASCSTKTFFISDPQSKESIKSARACDACYDAVFPILEQNNPASLESTLPPSNTVNTMGTFPTWLTIPSFGIVSDQSQPPTPEALMAIDLNQPRRSLHRIDDEGSGAGEEPSPLQTQYEGGVEDIGNPVSRIRRRSTVRPRSYHQILEDFLEQQEPADYNDHVASLTPRGPSPSHELHFSRDTSLLSEELSYVQRSTSSLPQQKEDTARRHKRFSLPAVALQTTAVTVQPRVVGEGRSKRFSLVLSGRSGKASSQAQYQTGAERENGDSRKQSHVGQGMAATRLNELLNKGRRRN